MARSAQVAGQPPHGLSDRDHLILADLARVRLLTGKQLERLHFSELSSSNARGSSRRRSLRRLTAQGWVMTLPRRIGGERAGSAGLIYSLDSRAHRERPLWDRAAHPTSSTRVRRPWAIGSMFVAHTLDVAELYVQLREAERAGQLQILTFDTEPAAWYHPGDRPPLKPDAHAVIETNGWERHWWIEVDRATESLPTLRRKLSRYVQAYQDNLPGPDGLLPRVLVSVPDHHRELGAHRVVRELLGPATDLIRVSRFLEAISVLPGDNPRPPP